MSRELSVRSESIFGVKLSAALLTRKRPYTQMFFVDVIPDGRVNGQDFVAFPTQLDAAFIGVGRRVKGFEKGLHFHRSFQIMLVKTFDEGRQLLRDIGNLLVRGDRR